MSLHTNRVVAYEAVVDETSAEIQRNLIEFPTLFVVGIIVVVVVITLIIPIAGIFVTQKREIQEKRMP